MGVDAFSVYQEVLLQPEEPRVCNVVEFGRNIGYLRVRLCFFRVTRCVRGLGGTGVWG